MRKGLIIQGGFTILLFGLILALAWRGNAQSFPFNLITLHKNATSNASLCTSCHGPKNSPDTIDPQTGFKEATANPAFQSAHVLHLTNPLLKFGCTDCHNSVDLSENRSGALIRKQVSSLLCALCHSPAVNEAHNRYTSNQCLTCHTGRHDSAPRFVNKLAITEADCKKCHGGKALFASRSTQVLPLNGTGTIEGKIVLSDGTPVFNLTILAIQNGRIVGLEVSRPLSDNTHYRLSNIPLGKVTLRIANAGHLSQKEVTLTNGGEVARADLVVKPILTLPAGYQEFSLPYTYQRLQPQDPAEILGIDPGHLKLAVVRGVQKKEDYIAYPAPEAKSFEPGRGYQIWLEKPLPVLVTGEEVPAPVVRVELKAGWNLIGNPYTSPIPWSGIRIQRTDGRTLSRDQAIRSGILARLIWVYNRDKQTYERANQLEPFRAYWVRVNTDCTLLLSKP